MSPLRRWQVLFREGVQEGCSSSTGQSGMAPYACIDTHARRHTLLREGGAGPCSSLAVSRAGAASAALGSAASSACHCGRGVGQTSRAAWLTWAQCSWEALGVNSIHAFWSMCGQQHREGTDAEGGVVDFSVSPVYVLCRACFCPWWEHWNSCLWNVRGAEEDYVQTQVFVYNACADYKKDWAAELFHYKLQKAHSLT